MEENLIGVVWRCLFSLAGRGVSELFEVSFVIGVLFVTVRSAGRED